MQRVPTTKEIHRILAQCHEGVCGGHFAQDITCKKILQVGFYWPSMKPTIGVEHVNNAKLKV